MVDDKTKMKNPNTIFGLKQRENTAHDLHTYIEFVDEHLSLGSFFILVTPPVIIYLFTAVSTSSTTH
jgi:hypothetical protein